MLVTETWPTRLEFNESLAGKFNLVIKATEFARKVKTYVGPEMEVSAEDDDLAELTKNLARLKSGSNLSSSLNIPGLEGWSLILSDESLVRYRNEIGRRVDELQAQIKNIEARLNNRAYIEKAPEKLVNESREVLASYKEELAELKSE